MKPFYATFRPCDGYHGGFVEIIAESRHAARSHMIREHGSRWDQLYGATEFSSVRRALDLVRIATVRQRRCLVNQPAIFDLIKENV